MLTEALAPPSSRTIESALSKVYRMDSQQLLAACNDALGATSDNETSAFRDIARVFLDPDVNHDAPRPTDAIDLQQEVVDDLYRKRALLLEQLMDNPAQSFISEYRLLETLFEGRRVGNEFCTQNHRLDRTDYLFRKTVDEDGAEMVSVDKVYDISGQLIPVQILWSDDHLTMSAKVYRRGRTMTVQVDPRFEDEILGRFFSDTIQASAIQMERSPEEVALNNDSARRKLIRFIGY